MLGRSGPRDELVSAMMASARRAVELDARDPVAHLGLAGAYLALGDPKNGLESIRRAVDLNPSMPMAWIWLGFVLEFRRVSLMTHGTPPTGSMLASEVSTVPGEVHPGSGSCLTGMST